MPPVRRENSLGAPKIAKIRAETINMNTPGTTFFAQSKSAEKAAFAVRPGSIQENTTAKTQTAARKKRKTLSFFVIIRTPLS
jgi:hypothetical protein